MASPSLTVDVLRAALATGARQLATGAIDMSEARPAGVAVPIALGEEPTLYLVLRGSHLADHAGEIAFPGGKREASDESLLHTAGREMREEVAVGEEEVEWLGELTPIPVITGRFLIHPFVAVLNSGVVPRVASGEIAEVLSLPLLPYVRGEVPMRAVTAEWNGARMLAPHFPVGGRILYGATAYITYELIARTSAAMGTTLPPLVIENDAPWGKRYA
ncbi:MAG: CoA pyrophosphatase [Polyangiaceae bacterium]